ncbi:unnamed protein product [Nezara viridula]|uniref:Uncharacterized protein n=1 Tax=Nezara viridula TaxID=85310 RepID=A0A9P0E6L9_NEZVI|nr:unnamed protein product [Nezara viridula]
MKKLELVEPRRAAMDQAADQPEQAGGGRGEDAVRSERLARAADAAVAAERGAAGGRTAARREEAAGSQDHRLRGPTHVPPQALQAGGPRLRVLLLPGPQRPRLRLRHHRHPQGPDVAWLG